MNPLDDSSAVPEPGVSAYRRRHGPWAYVAKHQQLGTVEFARWIAGRVSRKMTRLYWETRAAEAVPSAYGVRLSANWADATFRLCVHGQYGRHLASRIADERDPFIFLDVGANQGLFSLLAAKNPACAAVYSFEPVSATYGLLQSNIRLNGLEHRVVPLPWGISTSNARAQISYSSKHSGGASLQHTFSGGECEEVELRDGRAVAAAIADLPHRLIAKIDVEGHEPEVIAQLIASRLIHRVAWICYEVDETWCEPQALEKPLRAAGFSSFTKVGAGPSGRPSDGDATYRDHHYDVYAERCPAQGPSV